jgi:hypothetical protein
MHLISFSNCIIFIVQRILIVKMPSSSGWLNISLLYFHCVARNLFISFIFLFFLQCFIHFALVSNQLISSALQCLTTYFFILFLFFLFIFELNDEF